MLLRHRRSIYGVVFVLVASVLLDARIASAQEYNVATFPTEVFPTAQLDAVQDEPQFSRMQSAENQAWPTNAISRLPDVGHDDVIQTSGLWDNCDNPMDCDAVDCSCQSCAMARCDCRCNCFPCQCPLPQAPCIDCPRVSTLNPYFNVNVFGALKLDMLFNTARPIAAGTPFFLTPDSIAGLDQTTFDIHARQSTIGATFAGPQIGSFQSGGLVMAMFYNDAVIVDQYGFLPLQAYGELRNQEWRFAAGLQFDVFAPGLPTVLPFSALGASGNAGNSFRGQVRMERFFNPADDVQWTMQVALSEPVPTTIDPLFGINEDNGWPNVEGRVALGLGQIQGTGLSAQRPFEFGVSGIVGQLRNTSLTAGRVVSDVWGVSADFRWRVNSIFGVMGEFHTGQGLGTYNAGILQGVNLDTFEAIRTSGGWGEVYAYLTPCLHSHTGFAIDDPLDRDVVAAASATERLQNTTLYSNLLWDLNQVFRIGFEFAWRETDYADAGVPDNEGASFHTQFQWAF